MSCLAYCQPTTVDCGIGSVDAVAVCRYCVGKYFSEGDIKLTDYSMSVVEGTPLGNVKGYDDGLSVVGSTQPIMSHAEVVSKQ